MSTSCRWSISLLWLTLALLSPSAACAQDDDDERPLPRLLATYRLVDDALPRVVRYEALPAMLLAAGEAPDTRLPSRGWKAEWRGTIEILRPGSYRFDAQTSGTLEVIIGGQTVLSGAPSSTGKTHDLAGDAVTLPFGVQPIAVRYAPSGDGATLRLFWRSDSFDREPLPAYVLGHDAAQPLVEDLYLRGRLAVEEHSCVACHLPTADAAIAASLSQRPGPHLTTAGVRLKAGWIYRWLEDPQSLRPEAVMPALFSDDDQGRVERFAVARSLASLGQRAPQRKLTDDQNRRLAAEGARLFEQTGCTVCHERHGDRLPRATLLDLGHKTTPDVLSVFIRNPASWDPAGRMPGFDLGDDDAFRIAVYLTHGRNRATKAAGAHAGNSDADIELPPTPTAEQLRSALLGPRPSAAEALEFSTQPMEEQLDTLARRVLHEKRCVNCHQLSEADGNEPVKPRPAAHNLAMILADPQQGCLATSDKPAKASVPRFGPSLDRAAARAFLQQARAASGAAAPSETARLTLERFSCTACHTRNGQGGLPESLVERLMSGQTEQNAEMVSPPPLTSVTEKLLEPYLRKVLEEDYRSRPWMSLKMPRFGKQHIGHLPQALAALDAAPLEARRGGPKTSDELIEAGRTLVGSKGFGCTKCHDMLGTASQGTRGPELSYVPTRVNYAWFLRWMTDPQRIQPGTRMPTVFLAGESPYKEILGGNADQQRQAIWAYLTRSRGLPPPEGLNASPVFDVLASDQPVVFRTFLPDVSPRGIAIRSPNGVHLAFDAQSCRLAYGWSGQFLDLNPVWEGRGGMKAGLLGERFWSAPDGFPWEVTPREAGPPDFSKRGQDTSLGVVVPNDEQVHASRLRFRGYQTSSSAPRFSYELALGDNGAARFEESFQSLRTATTLGVVRQVAVRLPGDRALWWQVARADKPPEWQAAGGQRSTFEVSTPRSAAATVVTVIQQDKPAVLHLTNAPTQATWRVAEQAGKWSVFVHVPTTAANAPVQLSLVVQAPADAKNSVDAIVASALSHIDQASGR